MLHCFRAKYSTPYGVKYLSVKAVNATIATALLKMKTPYKAGWCFISLV